MICGHGGARTASARTTVSSNYPKMCEPTMHLRLLKERNEELERNAVEADEQLDVLEEENKLLKNEIETYAVVLQGCMDAQDTEHERNRAAAISASKEWNDGTLPLHTEPQQSSAGSSLGKRARASPLHMEQQQVPHAKLWDQKVRVTFVVRVGVFELCLTSYTTFIHQCTICLRADCSIVCVPCGHLVMW